MLCKTIMSPTAQLLSVWKIPEISLDKKETWLDKLQQESKALLLSLHCLETALPCHTALESVQKHPGRRKQQQTKNHWSTFQKMFLCPGLRVSVGLKEHAWTCQPAPESIGEEPAFAQSNAGLALHFFILSASGNHRKLIQGTHSLRGDENACS